MADEEEIRSEVEAVQAVYGDDCRVLDEFPPHLSVHIKPRTADDASQQFVEVTLGIKAEKEYPKKPPYAYIVEMKGLDDIRQMHLVARINKKAEELSSCLMLVSLCEEAVEILSSMNHPEGNCPLCLCPLVAEDMSGASSPFMKLMSCYHCFHSECIIMFWKWVQEQSGTKGMNQANKSTSVSSGNERGMKSSINKTKANCPVCRKEFDAMDMDHVLDYLGTSSSQSSSAVDIDDEERELLQSEVEHLRRKKFESLLKLQEENNGLIEPKKNLLILPGVSLPENVVPSNSSTETNSEQCVEATADANTCETNSTVSLNQATTSDHRSSESRRKKRFQGPKRPPHAAPVRKQWIKKDNTGGA